METNDVVKHYTNGEITVVWKPALCIHSKVCWQPATGLPEVFNPKVRPWVKMEGGTTDRIAQQVQKCPSGALRFYKNDVKPSGEVSASQPIQVEVLKGGPLMIYGAVSVKDIQGNIMLKEKATAFCRCGQSANKPYCDGSHVRAGFKD